MEAKKFFIVPRKSGGKFNMVVLTGGNHNYSTSKANVSQQTLRHAKQHGQQSIACINKKKVTNLLFQILLNNSRDSFNRFCKTNRYY